MFVLSFDPVPQLPPTTPGQHGAVLDFYGVVRSSEGGQTISGIEYSAYQSMAERMLGALIEEAATRFPDTSLFIHHSLGFVAAGQPSVLIRAIAKHSQQAFDLNRWALAELKAKVPIWKKPIFS